MPDKVSVSDSNVKIESYVSGTGKNYGVNALKVSIGVFTVYFSYQTIVAFDTPSTGLVVANNRWGNTTGKHLNAIDGGDPAAVAARLPRAEFDLALGEALITHGLRAPLVTL